MAKLLREYGFEDARRGRQFNGLDGSPDVLGLTGVHIECKRVERLNISQAMAQAVRDAEKFQDGAPTVFHRRNREGWLVTMQLSDWLGLFKNQGVK